MPSLAETFDALMPMEARLVTSLPASEGWQFEPKWDGFRALILATPDRVAIKSKSGKPLDRYFPELVDILDGLRGENGILDGEIIISRDGALSFDALQARLHPAASRIAKLSRETPADVFLFDCLYLGRTELTTRPLTERRQALETLALPARLRLSPTTRDPRIAEAWLKQSGAALDGVIAKPVDAPYQSGERAMLKVKQKRTADCVIGGYRTVEGGDAVASLLLGLYNEEGRLDHVGFTSGFAAEDRKALAKLLQPLVGGAGFTGKTPGGPSRWNDGKEKPWVPLKPEKVVEVVYDQVTARRFRHGTRFLRWRPDKAADQCRFDQLALPLDPAELEALMAKRR